MSGAATPERCASSSTVTARAMRHSLRNEPAAIVLAFRLNVARWQHGTILRKGKAGGVTILENAVFVIFATGDRMKPCQANEIGIGGKGKSMRVRAIAVRSKKVFVPAPPDHQFADDPEYRICGISRHLRFDPGDLLFMGLDLRCIVFRHRQGARGSALKPLIDIYNGGKINLENIVSANIGPEDCRQPFFLEDAPARAERDLGAPEGWRATVSGVDRLLLRLVATGAGCA